jgi:hypothetical protein
MPIDAKTPNAPKPRSFNVSNADPSFMVTGFQGYYAKVSIRLAYGGMHTITVTDNKTLGVLDTLEASGWGILVYLIDNLNESRYNTITVTTGTWSGKVIVEYNRTTY